ncbi:MAG TPA: PDR/VanB family oxidoreductase [Cellvibrio sp.]|nr:PDR/VanB family oxidoreductase [Cellvibrio sp.]
MTKTIERLALTITQITRLTTRIYRYQLRTTSGAELPLITAGSRIAIPVTLRNGQQDFHHYSICSNPNQREFYEIAVLLEENGSGGSQFIIEHFSVGTMLECGTPSNNFYLHADASPAILIAGGIGITPIISIAHTLALRGRRFQLHYAGRSKSDMAFVDELQKNFPRNFYVYAAVENQRLHIMNVLADAPSNTLFYACGPQKMLADIETSARMLGIDKDRIQTEHFVAEKSKNDKAVVLELAHSNKLIKATADQSLLTALRAAGVNVNFDCCVGDCGTCAVKILEGEAEHRDHVLSDAQKAQGFICVCVSRAKSDKLVLALSVAT